MTAFHLWDPWSPCDENLQWVRYSTNSTRKLDGAETIQKPSPSDQEVALYLQDGVVTADWNLLDMPGETGKATPKSCYSSGTECDAAIVIHKPHPIKLSSVDSVFGRAITTKPPKRAGGFHASEDSAFTEISVNSPMPTLTAQYKINFIMVIYRQLLRVVTMIYTAYQRCSYMLQHQI